MAWELHWDEVRVLDANAEALGVSVSKLMDAAGKALADNTINLLDETDETPVIWLLCGPGNNGGDGYVAARYISRKLPDAEIVILSSHSKQKTILSQEVRDIANDVGLLIHVWDSEKSPEDSVFSNPPSIIVDSLLGVGVGTKGIEPRGSILEILEWISRNSESAKVVACDIPTCLGSERALIADLTVTFHSQKIGFSEDPNLGEVIVVPLPWPDETINPGPGDCERYPSFSVDAKKGDRGRVLIVGGGPYHGAPVISGMAATRVGCDLVHLVMPSNSSFLIKCPPNIILEKIPDADFLTSLGAGQIIELMESRRFASMVIGPGLGRNKSTLIAVRTLLQYCKESNIPVVVDADAIHALAKRDWPDSLSGIATPHRGEAEAWLEDMDVEEFISEWSWLRSSSGPEEFAVIITGSEDKIHGLDGRSCITSGGHPRMAVGGTGDLLAGCLGGLLAIGMSPWSAARLGSWLMREAGILAVDEFGPGLVATDVPPFFSKVLAKHVK